MLFRYWVPFSRKAVTPKCVAKRRHVVQNGEMGDSNMSVFKREIAGLEQVEAVEGEALETVERDVEAERPAVRCRLGGASVCVARACAAGRRRFGIQTLALSQT